jgi:AcrR family transcriptional regulator
VTAQGATPGRARRTQEQRRAATSAKLIGATVSSLVELGYARTSIREICTRAGVSEGGLFGRFGSRLDVIVAAAKQIVDEQTAVIERRMADRRAHADPAETFVRVLHDLGREATSGVWLELLAAARTDAALREQLVPILLDGYAELIDVVRRFDLLPDVDDKELRLRIGRLGRSLHGDAIEHALVPDASQEAFVADQVHLLRTPLHRPDRRNRTRGAASRRRGAPPTVGVDDDGRDGGDR